MTAAELDLIAAFREVFGVPTFRLADDPASHEDEDTLLRSFGGLSGSARDMQRRPLPLVVDELGYDRSGTYYPSQDGAA